MEKQTGRRGIGVVIHQPLQDQIFSPELKQQMETLGSVRWSGATAAMTAEEAGRLLSNCEIGVGSWGTPWPNPEVLAMCPKLRLWVHAAGTVRHMFGDHLEKRDLTIASCAPAIAEVVAETTLGELIVGLRRIIPNAAANRAGRAPKPAGGKSLGSATVGVIGASQVGRRVVRNLLRHGARVRLYDPFVSEAQARELGAERVDDLVELCAGCDAVTVHAPKLESTRHMLSAAQFKAMRDDAIFINTARGSIVDEAALIAELEKGRLFAFMDVSDPEPAADDSPLRRLPNVIYTSHLAGGGPGHNIGRQVVSDIEAYLRGAQPIMVVTKEMLDRVA